MLYINYTIVLLTKHAIDVTKVSKISKYSVHHTETFPDQFFGFIKKVVKIKFLNF